MQGFRRLIYIFFLFIFLFMVAFMPLKVRATEGMEATYNLTFTKTEPDNKTVIEGSGYVLYTDEACRVKALYASGAAMDEFFTGNDGKIIINNLKEGTYYLKESTTPYGYESDKTVYKIEISPRKISLLDSSTNSALKGLKGEAIVKEVSFSNVDFSGNGIEGGSFAIYPDNNCFKAISEVKADSKGNVTFEGIRYGTYYLRQTKAAAGYRASGKLYKVTVSEDVIINDGNVDTTTITNDQTSDIVLILASEEDNTELIKGAKFGLYTDPDCTVMVDTAVSDNNGQIIFNDVTLRGSLYIRQLEVADPMDNGGRAYRMYDKRIYTVVIDELGNVTFPNITYEGFVFEECSVNKILNVPVTIVSVGALCKFEDAGGETLLINDIGREAESVIFSISAMPGTDTPSDNNKLVASYGATGRLARANMDIDVTFMPNDTIWRYKVEEVSYPVGYDARDERMEYLVKITKDEEGEITVRYAIDGSKFKLYKDSTQIIYTHTRTEDYDYLVAKAEEEAAGDENAGNGSQSIKENVVKTEYVPNSVVDSIYIIVPAALLVLLIILAVFFAIKQFGGKNISL